MKFTHLFALTALASWNTMFAAGTGFTVDKTAGGGVIVKRDGKLLAEYVVDQANKPYLAPVFGAAGKQMTRNYPMKVVDGEQHDHPHHRGIVFGHEALGDFDTWAERASFEEMNVKKPGSGDARIAKLGAIKHRDYQELKADADHATIVTTNDYLDPSGKKAYEELRRMEFRVSGDTLTIDFDSDLIATNGPVESSDKKDAGLSIRVPTSMIVDRPKPKESQVKPKDTPVKSKDSQGQPATDSSPRGHIITSEGKTDTEAWATRAKWCDYYGPVEGATIGVAILNHPSSFRFPTGWHVRTYGLFTANPFASQQFDKKAPDGGFTIKAGDRIKLRHRFVFHQGDEKAGKIAEAWGAYAKEAR